MATSTIKKGLKIQTGSISDVTTGTTASSGWYISTSQSVTFPRPFSSIPTVMIQEAGGNGGRMYRFRINGITTTGFTFWLIANVAEYTPVGTSWIAVEP